MSCLVVLSFIVLASWSVDVVSAQTGSDGTWWNASWPYRMKITIDNTKVDNENFAAFPILIKFTGDASLKAHLGYENGFDIVFVDSAQTTQLSHEIENCSKIAGNLTAWVCLTTLYDNENTVIYMYYGNSSTTSQENVRGVWRDNYVGVWHMNDNLPARNSVVDSTWYDNGKKRATTEPLENTGKMYMGQVFDNSNDSIRCNSGNSKLDVRNALTIQAWVNPHSMAPNTNPDWVDFICTKNYGDDAINGVYALDYNVNNFTLYFYNGGAATYNNSSVAPTINKWQRFVGFWNKLQMKNMLDNTLGGVTTYSTALTTGTSNFAIGINGKSGYTYAVDGNIDEVRVSDVCRSENYLRTSFRNENDPSTFYYIRAEESMPVTINNPNPLGYIENSDNLGNLYELDVCPENENLVAVCDFENDAIVIIDFTSKSAPVIIGTARSSTYIDGPTQCLWRGDYIYAAGYNGNTFAIIDASDPTNPVFSGYSTGINTVQGIDVQDNYAYAVSYGSDRLYVINISNPAYPTVIGTGSWFGSTIDQPTQIQASENYVYISVGGVGATNRFTIFDISNKRSPAFVSTITDFWPEENLDGPEEVIVVKSFDNGEWRPRYAYIAAWEANRFTVVDVRDPTNPYVLASLNDDENLAGIGRMDILDNYIFALSSTDCRFTVLDVSNPASPNVIRSVRNDNYLGNGDGIRVVGKYLYISSYDNKCVSVWSIDNIISQDNFTNQPTWFNYPTDLLTKNKDTSTAYPINPTRLLTIAPIFSAIHHDNENLGATHMEIEVGTTEGGNDKWDTGWYDISNIIDGERSENITYAGSVLESNITYYWRCRFKDTGGNADNWSSYHTFSINQGPNVPTIPLCEGLVDPTNISDLTPEFSATYSDNDYGDTTRFIHIQVGSVSGENDMWDSGWVQLTENTDYGAVDNNHYSPDVSYAGDPLHENYATYYWRCRFKDNQENMGDWSIENTFRMSEAQVGTVVIYSVIIYDNDNLVRIEWYDAENATLYQVQVDNENTFTAPLDNDNNEIVDNFYVTNLRRDFRTYWRVRGYNGSFNGDWSNTFTFNIAMDNTTEYLNGGIINYSEDIAVAVGLLFGVVGFITTYYIWDYDKHKRDDSEGKSWLKPTA